MVTVIGVPAVALDGALTTSLDPAAEMPAALTAMSPEVPVAAAVVVSVAVTVFVPAVLSVTAKVPVPFTRVVLAGRTAALSLE
ncbi:MAG: hypothetical protein WCL24_12830, partial [Verrucomicrobiota bacterium]